MLRQTIPKSREFDVLLNRFGSCIIDTSKKFLAYNLSKLNLVEEGNSSLCLKTEVSLPLV